MASLPRMSSSFLCFFISYCLVAVLIVVLCVMSSQKNLVEPPNCQIATWCLLFCSISNLVLFRGWLCKSRWKKEDWSELMALVTIFLPDTILLTASPFFDPIWRWGVCVFQVVTISQFLLQKCELLFTISLSQIMLMTANACGMVFLFCCIIVPSHGERLVLMSLGLAMILGSLTTVVIATLSTIRKWYQRCKAIQDDGDANTLGINDEDVNALWNAATYLVLSAAFIAIFLYFQAHQHVVVSDAEISAYVFFQSIALFSNTANYSFISSRRNGEVAVAVAMKLNRGFVRYISHELRSHLNHISADIFTLRQERGGSKDDPSRKNRLRVLTGMQDACDRAVGILDDVLIFDKLRDDRSDKEKKWSLLDVKVALRTAVDEVVGQVHKNSVTMQLSMDLRNRVTMNSDHVKLHADGDEVVQALKVLLDQAVKASPPGAQVKVRVEIVSEVDDDEVGKVDAVSRNKCQLHDDVSGAEVAATKLGLLKVDVIDQGSGMSQENLETLFRHAASAQSNVVHGGQGSGLGLSIAKHFVEKNFGRLSADSGGYGNGCTFSIVMPVYAIHENGDIDVPNAIDGTMAHEAYRSHNDVVESDAAMCSCLKWRGRNKWSIRVIPRPPIAPAPDGEDQIVAFQSNSKPAEERDILFEAYERLDADRISIFAFNDFNRKLECIISQDIKGMQIDVTKGIVGACFLSAQIMNVQSTTESSDYCSDIDQKTQFRTKTILCAPIMGTGGVPVGVMQALNKRHGPRFTKDDEDIIRDIAERFRVIGVIERRRTALMMTISIRGSEHDPMQGSLDLSSTTREQAFRRALHLLIVDADRAASNMLRYSLQHRLGHNVEVVSNLFDAVESVKEAKANMAPFDAIFLDAKAILVGKEAGVTIGDLVNQGFVGRFVGCADDIRGSHKLFDSNHFPITIEKPVVGDILEKIMQALAKRFHAGEWRKRGSFDEDAWGDTNKLNSSDGASAEVHTCLRRRVLTVGGSITFRKLWLHILSRQLGYTVQQLAITDAVVDGLEEATSGDMGFDVVLFLPCDEGNTTEAVMAMRDYGIVSPVVAINDSSASMDATMLEMLGVRVVEWASAARVREVETIFAEMIPLFDQMIPLFDQMMPSQASRPSSLRRYADDISISFKVTADDDSNKGDAAPRQCVLIADNSTSSRKTFRRLLRNKGFDVVESTDNAEAIQAFDIGRDFDEEFHVIFIDCALSTVMSGPDCCNELRKRGCSSLLVGLVNAKDRVMISSFMASGANVTITKPVTEQKLNAMLAWAKARGASDNDKKSTSFASKTTKSTSLASKSVMATELDDDELTIKSASVCGDRDEVAMSKAASAPSDNVVGSLKLQSLVVDDMLSNRKILVRLLEKEGHALHQADDGLQALAQYDKAQSEGRPFDFIFMDFVMPNLDGPGAVRELRRRGCAVPIIGVTGNMMREDVEAFKAAGADEVMGKPVKAVKLRDLLRAKAKSSVPLEGVCG